MEISITLNINVPADGMTPNVTVISNKTETAPEPVSGAGTININTSSWQPDPDNPEDMDTVAKYIWGNLQRIARQNGMSDALPKVGIKPATEAEMDKVEEPKKKRAVHREPLPEKPCLQCGDMFVPNVARQKFDDKKCKDNYYRAQKAVRETASSDKRKTKVSVPKKTTEVKEVVITPQRIPDVQVSSDDFYRQQLKKAAKKSPDAYGKYLTASDIKDLESA